ncbi:MAG: hypothetical protein ACRD16_14530 [Thermoanaerobaculia bacterium]
MKASRKLLGAAAAAYFAFLGVETLSAKPMWVKQSKDLGFPAENCLYCHTEKLPKKDKAKDELNDRGKWLVAQRDDHKVKDVDLKWLKDYPGGKDQK